MPALSRCDVSRPEDFDEFWDATLRAAEAIPLNASIERCEPRCTETVDAFDVRYDSLDGLRVAAWYCRPKEAAGPLPGVVLPPGYIQDPPLNRHWAERGFAAFTPAPRAKLRSRTAYDPGYPGLLTHNIVDRNTYGYRGFYVDVIRGIDVLKSLAEVDAERLGICGFSQGGALAIVAPALRPHDLKAAVAGVPYLTDYLGAIELTRTYPFHEIADYLQLHPERRPAVKETLAYFDCLNFAPQVTCPILVSLGTQDNIVPPETCRAAFEAIASADKTLHSYTNCGHDGGMTLGFTEIAMEFMADQLRLS